MKGTVFGLICIITFFIGNLLWNILKIISENNVDINISLIVLFIIISCINVYFEKGCKRIIEVSKRFIIDSLPGRLMTIESQFSNDANLTNMLEDERLNQKNILKNSDNLDSFIKLICRINIIVVLVCFPIVLTLEVLYVLKTISIHIEYINNIIFGGILIEILFLIIFGYTGKSAAKMLQKL